VINAILLSTLYYFIAISSGSIQAIRSVRGSLRNYLWSGIEHNSRTRVCWDDCCLSKNLGGLKLLDPEVSLSTLLVKWILFTIEPDISNLKVLLRYRINKMKPNPSQGFWFSSQAWLMVPGHSVSRGSRVWNRVTSAWKRFTKYIEFSPLPMLMKFYLPTYGGPQSTLVLISTLT